MGTERTDIRRVEQGARLADAWTVRRAVFVDEQGVPAGAEFDGHDTEATHVVAYAGAEPVGTARVRAISAQTAKVERVAVLAPRRGEGLGRALMDRLESVAGDRGHERVRVHAQTAVEGFYRGLGYERVGDEFEQAGISHVRMVKPLRGTDGPEGI